MELKKPAVHLVTSKVYHSNENCSTYKRTNKQSFKSGTGRKTLCKICAELDTPGIKLSRGETLNLHAASKYLDGDVRMKLGLQIPFDIYLQDPMVAANNPKLGSDEMFYVNWEPGISDGPTSARFVIVDYNADTEKVAEPAQWDEENSRFVKGTIPVGLQTSPDPHDLQFHQVNVWAVLQRALQFFEDSMGMGRHIPWGFPGNRLIVLPHAGYGQNAFYDRTSKSLQFYYFGEEKKRIYTCLSSDIVNHEFGHAILDGIRPYFYESTLIETGAFHEFVGDLTAILMILRNNSFRKTLAGDNEGDVKAASPLNAIAEQFGSFDDKPYLRTATNELKMDDIIDMEDSHGMSEVLTGTMFDILDKIARSYYRDRGKSWVQALNYTIQKMQPLALQALDFLPPIDATFKDYGIAVLRSFELSDPRDEHNYYEVILNAFYKRGIFNRQEYNALKKRTYFKGIVRARIMYPVEDIGSSRATAYRFLDDNRNIFMIPRHQDFEVVDLYDAQKSTQDRRWLPKQTILQYLWKEEVQLEGRAFGEFAGEMTTISCGGTIVFDENDSILFWSYKYATIEDNTKTKELAEAKKRKRHFLQNLAKRINLGHIGAPIGSGKGILGSVATPLVVQKTNGHLDFRLTPHLSLAGNINDEFKGNKKWQVSS